MSLNLDALNDENVLEDESQARSTERDNDQKKSKKPKSPSTRKSDRLDGSVSQRTLIRHAAFFILFVAAGIAAFLFRDDVMANVGYGALPLGLWSVLFVYLLITRTRWIIGRYRETISSLIVVVGGAAVLGIFDAPLGAASGATMGGRLGETLAREPWDWHRYDLVLWQQALAWVRVGALFTVGAALQFPKAFGFGMKVIWVGLMVVFAATASLFVMAGGAAATMASNRKKSQPETIEPDHELETPTTTNDTTDNYTAFQPENHSLVFEKSELSRSDDVVIMGNTLVVGDEDDEEVVEFVEEDDWQTTESSARNHRIGSGNRRPRRFHRSRKCDGRSGRTN